MTKNDVANAFGWDMLFRDYKIDILSECGPRTFARHTFKVAGLFIRGGMYGRGYRQYLLGLWHWIRPAKNRFSYPLSEIVEASNYIFGLTFLKLIGKIK
ncbi:MAG: hypothetical protein EOP48_34300 [Sphingobacteriales bacterium]|nr:MAG: hypothetical protein EOP48_34300 [Sphingobacteriales bacterium]